MRGVVGVSIDIGERKKTEQKILELLEAKKTAEEHSQAKTKFIEEMRHDIRTPLSGIVGTAELLNIETSKEKPRPERLQDYTKCLIASSQALMSFLNNVLESVNSGMGNIPLSIQRFNLYENFSQVIALHQAKALEKGLVLALHYDSQIPTALMGDPVRIYRIVLELLSNALKFTEQGSIQVRVLLAQKRESELVIQCEIEDTGPGIPKDKQADLFSTFSRLSPSYKGLHQGAGLGLSIAKNFTQDMKGELYLDSDGIRGSRFVCLWPLKVPLLMEMPESLRHLPPVVV